MNMKERILIKKDNTERQDNSYKFVDTNYKITLINRPESIAGNTSLVTQQSPINNNKEKILSHLIEDLYSNRHSNRFSVIENIDIDQSGILGVR